ncbi:MAG: ATP-binding cassette domain-containing protein [Candidatus Aminicenantes bacterium]|nr:ATP-binding cassette domain-containing protein [Candidatus Aminicenantes bacterium]
MENTILEIKNISKSSGDITALTNFSVSLQKGEILGLLGPNGAGKTTLISILSGTVKDFSGAVTFKGKSLFADRKLKNYMGIVPQDMAFYEDLNALDNLLFWGGLYDMPGSELKQRALEELIKIVGEKELVDVAGEFAAAAMANILKQADFAEMLSVADNGNPGADDRHYRRDIRSLRR